MTHTPRRLHQGFERKLAVEALRQTDNNLEASMTLLSTQPHLLLAAASSSTPTKPSSSSTPQPSDEQVASVLSLCPAVDPSLAKRALVVRSLDIMQAAALLTGGEPAVVAAESDADADGDAGDGDDDDSDHETEEEEEEEEVGADASTGAGAGTGSGSGVTHDADVAAALAAKLASDAASAAAAAEAAKVAAAAAAREKEEEAKVADLVAGDDGGLGRSADEESGFMDADLGLHAEAAAIEKYLKILQGR